jgi:O-antigen/teichoic acid export membrane protein
MSLKGRAFSAVRWTSVIMIGKAAIAFSQVVLLAHIMSPAEIGIVALTMTVVNTTQIISDMGISNALIHHDNVSDEELSSLFWLNVFSGVTLTLALFLCSTTIAAFYREPKLTVMICLASLYFIIQSLGSQQRVLAEKSLNFKMLSCVELTGFFTGFAVSITCALFDFGAISVVIGYLFGATVYTSLAWITLSKGWRPKLHFRLADVSRFWKFGVKALGVSLSNTLALQSDVIVAGRGFGSSVVGAYFQPRELVLRIMFVINPIITRVGFPLMSLAKSDRNKVKKIYLKTLRMTSSTNFPIYLFISAFSNDIVLVLFGERWNESGPILQLLGLWCAVRSVGNPVGSLLMAMGETKRAFRSAATVMVCLFIIGAFAVNFGLNALIVGLIIFYSATIPGFWAFLVRPACGAKFLEYHAQIATPAALSTISVGIGYVALLGLSPHFYMAPGVIASISRLIFGGLVSGISYLFVSWLFNRQWIDAILELLIPSKAGRA